MDLLLILVILSIVITVKAIQTKNESRAARIHLAHIRSLLRDNITYDNTDDPLPPEVLNDPYYYNPNKEGK